MFWNALRVFFFFWYSIFLDSILFPLIAFCFLNSSATQFYPTLRLRSFVMLSKPKKTFKTHLKNTLYTCKQPLMMAYEGSESAPDNFGKFIHQLQSETKTLLRKPRYLSARKRSWKFSFIAVTSMHKLRYLMWSQIRVASSVQHSMTVMSSFI